MKGTKQRISEATNKADYFHQKLTELITERMSEMTDAEYAIWLKDRYRVLSAELHEAFMKGELSEEDSKVYQDLPMINPNCSPLKLKKLSTSRRKRKLDEDHNIWLEDCYRDLSISEHALFSVGITLDEIVGGDTPDGIEHYNSILDSYNDWNRQFPESNEILVAEDPEGFERIKNKILKKKNRGKIDMAKSWY